MFLNGTDPATLKVETVSDIVCLDLAGTQCASDFVFYEIVDEDVASIIEDISGILGFATGTEDQPSYLEALATAGVIDAPEVTVNLNTLDGTTSTITLGTYGDSATTAVGPVGTVNAADTNTTLSFANYI